MKKPFSAAQRKSPAAAIAKVRKQQAKAGTPLKDGEYYHEQS